jgi:hypothetical protein
MRLTRRFVLAIAAVIMLVLGLKGALDLRREVRHSDADVRRDARVLGTVIAHSAQRVWTNEGEKEAIEFVDQMAASGGTIQVRWVWLDAAPGRCARARAHLAPTRSRRPR